MFSSTDSRIGRTDGINCAQQKELLVMTTENTAAELPMSAESVAERMMVHRAKFLNFLTKRVSDPLTAEDILQSAYIKAIEHGSEIRDDESTVAWFYRLLRNAITDSYRREVARNRAHEDFAAEAPLSYEPGLEQTVCACIGDVIENLKTEYREAIEQVDLGGMTVSAFAQAHGTSANNASVRLYRARKDVAKKLATVCGTCAEHKCLDCTCHQTRL